MTQPAPVSTALSDVEALARAHRLIAWGVVLAAFTLAYLGWREYQFDKLTQQYHAVALKAANDSARLDTTSKVLFSARDSAKFLGDSLHAVSRLAVQEQQRADALDKTLAQIRTANTVLTATVKTLAVTKSSTAPVHTDSATDTRSASFVVDSTPYHVHATVSLPKLGEGSIALGVRLDSAHITVRSACEAKADANGIRAARVSILSPPWLSLNVASSTQDDQVCNATQAKGRGWFGFPDVIAGAGWTLNGHGSGFGVFIGGGLRVGP